MNWLSKHRRIIAALLSVAAFAALSVNFASAFHEGSGVPDEPPPDDGGSFSFAGIIKKVAGVVLGGTADILGSTIGWGVYILLTVFASIAGVGIMIITFFIQIILQLSQNIQNTPPVQIGFQISLAIANLGFVLAIIVIAVATIARRETYGLKQNLARLIIAAILVNFGLVIAAPIIGLTNEFTTFFMQGATGSGDPSDFASALAGSFTPQRFLLVSENGSVANIENSEGLAGFASAAGQAISSLITPIVSILFVLLSLIAIIVSLGAFFVMFLIRYLILSFLLILMPFAWLSWAVPALRSQWSKWWNMFFKWTLFAPLAMFFLYLSILTQASMDSDASYKPLQDAGNLSATSPDGLIAAVATFFGTFFSSLIGPMLQMVVVMGLTIGGLYAANRLSITGAGAALSMATGAGKWVGGVVGRRAKQAATAPLRTKTGKEMIAGLQQSGVKATGLRKFIGAPADYVTRRLGRGLDAVSVAGGEKAVEGERQRSKGITTDQKINAMATASLAPQRIAWLQDIAKEGRLSEVNGIEKYLSEDKEDEFKRYNQGKSFKELRDSSGLTVQKLVRVRDMQQEYLERMEKDRAATPHDKAIAEDHVRDADAALEKHFKSTLKAADLAANFFPDLEKLKQEGKPLPLGMSDAELGKVQKAFARGIAEGFSPQSIAKIFEKLERGDQLENIIKVTKSLGLSEKDVNDRTKQWLENNGARNLGLTFEGVFGIRKASGGSTSPGGPTASGGGRTTTTGGPGSSSSSTTTTP